MAEIINRLPIAGIVTNEFDAKQSGLITNHVDKTTYLPFVRRGDITNLGNRDIYALSHREETPFMLPNIEAGTVEVLNGYEYKFSVATSTKLETTIVSVDVAAGDKAGQVGVPFKITLSNASMGSHGARFVPSVFNAFPMDVLDVHIKGGPLDHVQYTVIYNGNMYGDKFIPQDAIKGGTKVTKLGGTRSPEFGQDWDSWAINGGQNREFIARISDFQIQTHYSMTHEGCRFANGYKLDKEWMMNNLNRVVEYVGVKKSPNSNGSLNPNIKTFNDLSSSFGGGNAGNQKAGSVIGFKFLTTLYDKISIGILNKEMSNMMVWDPGGLVGNDGLDKRYIHPGIWHQMNYSGVKHEYAVGQINKEMILAMIRSYEKGRKSKPSFGNERTYRIRTGEGGIWLLNKIFEKEFLANVTGQVMAKELGQFSGTYQTGLTAYTPYFKSIKISSQYELVWDYDPSMNGNDDDMGGENPLVNGYRLSSFVMILEDADFSSSNIKILKADENSGDIRMAVVNGTMSHPFFQENIGNVPAHLASNTKSGFTSYFTAFPDTAVMWDPTVMLKLSPRNPYTGKAIF